ncbi:MAG: DUF86 domain-containing protein [Coriobacteriales bacterium]|nr:DUF86 domain-containing protein [Coriobacteriales bacterium]
MKRCCSILQATRNIEILRRIVVYCDEAEETCRQLGDSLEALRGSSTFRNAASMCVLQIGELSTHLTEEFRTTHPAMPWKSIRGMRNVAVHHYGSFDTERLWNTLKQDIPSLRDCCAHWIAELSKNPA